MIFYCTKNQNNDYLFIHILRITIRLDNDVAATICILKASKLQMACYIMLNFWNHGYKLPGFTFYQFEPTRLKIGSSTNPIKEAIFSLLHVSLFLVACWERCCVFTFIDAIITNIVYIESQLVPFIRFVCLMKKAIINYEEGNQLFKL